MNDTFSWFCTIYTQKSPDTFLHSCKTPFWQKINTHKWLRRNRIERFHGHIIFRNYKFRIFQTDLFFRGSIHGNEYVFSLFSGMYTTQYNKWYVKIYNLTNFFGSPRTLQPNLQRNVEKITRDHMNEIVH